MTVLRVYDVDQDMMNNIDFTDMDGVASQFSGLNGLKKVAKLMDVRVFSVPDPKDIDEFNWEDDPVLGICCVSDWCQEEDGSEYVDVYLKD